MAEQLGFLQDDGGSSPTSPLQLWFKPISTETLNVVAREKHYLHREVNTSWAWGAYHEGVLLGAISFAKPASPAVCKSVCGIEEADRVYELNRLWMADECPRNSESRFIGFALRQLRQVKPPLILISYADIGVGHIGIVYKATNWLFTGETKIHFDKTYSDGRHPRSMTPEDREREDDENVIVVERSRKNRYVYFFDPKDRVKLKSQVLEYPKEVLSNETPSTLDEEGDRDGIK